MSESPNMSRTTSLVLIQLLKGVVYQDQHQEVWRELLRLQGQVSDYFSAIGLRLVVDETEGYAFLRQRPEEEAEGTEPLPRLVQRRSLSYPVSMLCVLLRRKLAELDADGGDTRLILTRQQIVEMLRVFLAERSNEAKVVDQIEGHIVKLCDLGLLRPLKGEDVRFEVRRIIKALVDAEWLTDFEEKLEAYRSYADSSV